MDQFELTLLTRRPDDSIESVDTIKADDLVYLLSQLLIVIVGIQKRFAEEIPAWKDNDIPF